MDTLRRFGFASVDNLGLRRMKHAYARFASAHIRSSRHNIKSF
jgi:hypothetical protein